jgi:hypothetical protein
MLFILYAGFVNEASVVAVRKRETNHQAGIINLFDTVYQNK